MEDTTNTNTITVTNTVVPKKIKKNKDVVANTDTNANTSSTAQLTTLSFDNLAQQVNVNNPSWDMFLIGFFIIGALLYGMSLGKDRIIAIMVSIYMALVVVTALPQFVLNIRVNENYTVQITAFFAVFVILFFMLSRQAVLTALAPNSQGRWWQVLLFSVLHVGLLTSVTMSYLPATILAKFSPLTQSIFTTEWTKFGWIIAPIAAMVIVGKSEEKGN